MREETALVPMRYTMDVLVLLQSDTGFLCIVIFQLIMTTICFWFIPLMLRQRGNSITMLMLSIAFMGFAQNAAYLLELLSTNVNEAMMAVRMESMGSAFICTFMLLFIAGYFEKKVPVAFQVILIILDMLVVAGTWIYKIWPAYFCSPRFVHTGIMPHLELRRGPLYYVFVLAVTVQLISCLCIEWNAFAGARDKSKKTRYFFMLLSTLFPGLGYLMKLLDVLDGFNLIPCSTALGILMFMIATVFQHAFEVTITAHEDIVREMDEAVIVTNREAGFIEANKKAYELFPALYHVEREERVPDTEKWGALEEGIRRELNWNRHTFDVHVNGIYSHEKMLGYCIMLLDVTEQKKQLELMQQLKENAESANSAKTDFLARMSHEIRTPINAVLGMNEMILRESSEENVKKYATDIHSAAHSLLSIINDILDTSKIETGKMEIVPVRYDLSTLLNDTINMIAERAKDKELDFVIDVSPSLPAMLYGDDLRIRQVLLNLLSNAVKYTKTGSVKLSVKGYNHRDKAVLRFMVEDTGIGIRKEDIPKLFESFERINLRQNRNIEGTGLGLPITVRLLKLMESELRVESTYGVGSKFWFDLEQPIIGTDVIGDFRSRAQRITQGYVYTKTYTAEQAKILVVDDNEINRRVFCNLVKQTKVQVSDVGSGQACLNLIQKKHFDLIFLDHMMPEMDGIETLRNMKKLEHNLCADTPVVMLTANAVSGAREQYLKEGFHEFLSKPIDPKKLEQMMKRFLPENLIHDVAAQSEEEG